MKKTILKTVMALVILGSINMAQGHVNYAIQTSQTENVVTTTFGVSGNCGMCKSTIEKAALSVKGVTMASWDVKKKEITVTYDSTKTKLEQIHLAIAKSGYDTETTKASETNYNKLPGCCQYDRNMPISNEEKK
jgi:mercuric ion binding protein